MNFKDILELGPFCFTVIGFEYIYHPPCRIFQLDAIIQIDRIVYLEVNGYFVNPVEIDDWFAVQPDTLRNDILLNLENFLKTYYDGKKEFV